MLKNGDISLDFFFFSIRADRRMPGLIVKSILNL